MLTEQKKQFVEEYLKLRCKNQAQAAINAGYSEKSAASQASRLVNDCEVIEYLNFRRSQLESELRQEFFFDAIQARKAMYRIMTDNTSQDKDIIAVAKDFLDRAGFKPQDKVELSGELKTNNPLEGLSTEDLKKLIDDD